MATLRIDVEVDTSQGTATLKQFASDAESATKKVGDAAKAGSTGVGQFNSTLDETVARVKSLLNPVSALEALVGVGLVAGLTRLVSMSTQWAQELQRLKVVTGDTIGQLAEIQGAAQKLGIGADKLQRAFFFLSSEIESGGANLAKMGISLRDSENIEKSHLKIIEEMGVKFRAMGDETKQAVIARKVLSKSAVDLLEIFTLEKKAIEELGASERRFAELIGEDGAKSLRRFGGEFNELWDATKRLGASILFLLLPPLRLLVGAITGVVDAAALLIGIAGRLTNALVSMVPQIVIDTWKTLTDWINNAYEATKKWLGLSTVEPPEAATPGPDNVGEMQRKLALTQQLIQSQIALAQATLDPIPAQIVATKAQNAIQLAQLDISIAQIAATNADRALQVDRARLVKARADLETAGLKEVLKLEAQAAIARLNINVELEKSAIAVFNSGRLAAENLAVVEIDAAKKAFKELHTRGVDTEKGLIDRDKRIAIAKNALTVTLNKLDLDRLQKEVAIEELIAEQAHLTVEQQVKDQIVLAENWKKNLAIRLETNQIGLDDFVEQTKATNIEILGQQRLLFQAEEANVREHEARQIILNEDALRLNQEDLATFVLEEKKIREQAAEDVAGIRAKENEAINQTATQNLELTQQVLKRELAFRAEVEDSAFKTMKDFLEKKLIEYAGNARAIEAIQAKQFENEKARYDKEVQIFINAELLKSGLLTDELAKRLAKEAGAIDAKKQFRDKEVNDAATVFSQESRQAGDLSRAYQVGFAEAASKASDAFDVMRTAGQQAFADLKTGLSDFLFDTFTGAKKIGDIFADLGKRILRTFLDAFAAISVRQAAMALGFSLPGALGVGTALAAGAGGLLTLPSNAPGVGDAAQAAATGLEAVSTASQSTAGTMQFLAAVIGMLGKGVLGVVQFMGNLISGVAGLVGWATGSAAPGTSPLAGFGNLAPILTTIARGVTSLFTSASSSIFKVLTSVSESFFGSSFTMSIAPLLNTIANWALPVVGTVISIVMDLIHGNVRGAGLTALGASIGAFWGPIGLGIGAVIGKLVDWFISLFEGPPTATLYIRWQSTFISRMDDFLKGVVGSFGVFVSADLPNDQQRKMEVQISELVNGILRSLLGAFNQASAKLPASISATMTAGLEKLANSEQWVWAGRKEGFTDFNLKDTGQLKAFLEHDLSEWIIHQFFQAMSGGLNLRDFQRGGLAGEGTPTGEAFADTFARVLSSMVGLAALMKAFGMDADAFAASLGTGDEALRAYITASVDFFESFRVGTETFKETADRLSQAVGGMQVILEATGHSLPTFTTNLADMHDWIVTTIAFFTQFQTEGEAFADTVKRVTEGLVGLVGLAQQLEVAIVGLTGTADDALAFAVRQIEVSGQQIDRLMERLRDAITQGGQPDDILALGKALTEAVTTSFKAQIDLAKALSAEVDRLRASLLGALQLFASLATTLFSLQENLGAAGPIAALDTFWASINRLVMAFQQADTVETRVQLISAALGIFVQALNDAVTIHAPLQDIIDSFNEFNGLLQQGFDMVMGDIFAMTDPARAVANLQALAQAIVQATNAEIAAAQRYFDEQATLLTAASQLRIDALNAEKTAITEAADVQKAALNTQLELTRKWASVLESVKSQLTGLFNLIAPTHPLTSLTDVRSQFQAAVEQFRLAPTPELAKIIQDLGAQAIDLAKSTPGFELPSLAFKALFDEITAALNLIKDVAEPTISEADILQQIADIDQDAADRLAAIDLSIKAEQDALKVALDANSAKEQEILTGLRQQAVERLQRLQDALVLRLDDLAVQEQLASDRLHALIGDRTLDEFIAAKNAEQATLLGEIRDLLTDMLGALGFESPVSAARLSEAVLSLVKLAELAQGLFEGGQLGTPEIGQQLMIASQQAALRQPQGVIDALTRVVDLGKVFFASDAGTAAMTALSQVIGDIGSNQFQAAINDLAALVQMLNDAGITNRVIVPGFQQGTDYVPQTGLAVLHQGERVLTAEDNRWLTGVLGSVGAGQNAASTTNVTVNVHVEAGAQMDGHELAGVIRREVEDSLQYGAGSKIIEKRVKRR